MITLLLIALFTGILLGFANFDKICDWLVEFMEPHADCGPLYREYINIGNRISKAVTFKQITKLEQQIAALAAKYPENEEAQAYVRNLTGLVTRRDMQLRSNIPHYRIFKAAPSKN